MGRIWILPNPEDPVAVSSRFNDITLPQHSQLRVPSLPDLKDLVCRQFDSPAALHSWSPAYNRFLNVYGWE